MFSCGICTFNKELHTKLSSMPLTITHHYSSTLILPSGFYLLFVGYTFYRLIIIIHLQLCVMCAR